MIGLGQCCMCEEAAATITILLDRRAAVPGHGWGCVVCGLAPSGACAVLCVPCFERYRHGLSRLTRVCRGYPAMDGRCDISELPSGVFAHDRAKHPKDTE